MNPCSDNVQGYEGVLVVFPMGTEAHYRTLLRIGN